MRCIGKRDGYSLIELMMVISVAAVLMMVNVGWMHQSMKFASSMTQRHRHHQNLTRLGWAFRDDVWQSESISVVDDNRLVLNWQNGTEASYTISDTSLVVEKQEQLAEGPRTKREVFELASGSIIRWETAELPDWISLTVFRENKGAPGVAPDRNQSESLKPNAVPIDFHIRVGPKRRAWQAVLSDRTDVENEDSK